MLKKKPKKQALWKTAFPEQAVKTPAKRKKAKRTDPEYLLYKQEAREFIRRAQQNGVKCPIVTTIEDLKLRANPTVTEVHHTRGRAGSLLRDQRWWLAVSRCGHNFVHENIELAREYGWICPKGEWNRRPLEK